MIAVGRKWVTLILPPALPFPPLPPLYNIPLAASSKKHIRGLPYGSSSREEDQHGVTKSRGKLWLQSLSDPASICLQSGKFLCPRCRNKRRNTNLWQLKASLRKLLSSQLLPFQVINLAPFHKFLAFAVSSDIFPASISSSIMPPFASTTMWKVMFPHCWTTRSTGVST